jgi:hypothetical protein
MLAALGVAALMMCSLSDERRMAAAQCAEFREAIASCGAIDGSAGLARRSIAVGWNPLLFRLSYHRY